MNVENKTIDPSPDMLEVNKIYSVTINPNDDNQYKSRYNKRLKYIWEWLSKKLYKYKDWLSFKLYPEISNSKQFPRVHFHGLFRVKSIEGLLRFYSTIRHHLGKSMHLDIDTINDPEHWYKYCTKNKKTMQQFCELLCCKYILYTEELHYSDDEELVEETPIPI